MAADRRRLDPVQLEQLHRLRVLAGGHLDLVRRAPAAAGSAAGRRARAASSSGRPRRASEATLTAPLDKIRLWTRASWPRSARSSSAGASPRRRRGSASRSPPSASRCARSSSGSARSCSTAPAGGSSRPRRGCASTAARSGMLALEEQLLEELGRAGRAAPRDARARRLHRARRRSSSRCSSASSSATTPAPRRALRVRHAVGRRARRRPAARARHRRRGPAAPLGHLRAVLPRRGDPRLPARASVRRAHGRARRAAEGAADPDAAGRRRPPDGRGRAAQERPQGSATSTSRSSSACRSRCGAPSRPASASGSSRGAPSRPSSPPGRSPRRACTGLDLARDIYIARATGRAGLERRAGIRRVRAREARRVIVRWGLEELPGLLDEVGVERPLLVAGPALGRARDPGRRALERRSPPTGSPSRPTSTGSSRSAAAARSTPARPRPPRRASRSSRSRRRTPAPSGRRSSASALPTGSRSAAARARGRPGSSTTPELTLDLPRAESAGTAMNALAHCVEALYPGELEEARRGAAGIDWWLPRVLEDGARPRGAHGPPRGGERRGPGARRARPLPRARDGAGGRRHLRAPARRDERALPPAGDALQRARSSRTR